MQEVFISNLPPVWVQWMGNIGLFLFGIAMVLIAVKLVGVLTQLGETLGQVNKIIEEDVHRDMMPDVKAITKNVKTMSDDAANTAQHITGTVDRVTHVISSVTTKLESPTIRAVGAITGMMAGARALSSNKPTNSPPTRKRGGLFGILKK